MERLAGEILGSLPKRDPLEQVIKIVRFMPKLKRWAREETKRQVKEAK